MKGVGKRPDLMPGIEQPLGYIASREPEGASNDVEAAINQDFALSIA